MKRFVLVLMVVGMAMSMSSCEKDNYNSGRYNGQSGSQTGDNNNHGGGSSVGGFDSNGASNALFSVSPTKKVRFSRGNLQYNTITGIWRFAPNQYDFARIEGDDLRYISSDGWMDLFGFGTSGWNSGANAYLPTSTSDKKQDYYVGGSYTNDLTGTYANADWGVYNSISNGGNRTRIWRTPTADEWNYLISDEGPRAGRWALATIDGKYSGMIILPDEWTTPSGLYILAGGGSWTRNVFTINEWKKLEASGAIFLPQCGWRSSSVRVMGNGKYWSVNHKDDSYIMCLSFSDNIDAFVSSINYRFRGFSVRLIQDK